MNKISSLIAICEATRKFASDTVRTVLPNCIGKSEQETATLLLQALQQNPELRREGWYNPPPNGVAVLASGSTYSRLNYRSLRLAEYWPSQNILDEDSVITCYVSPVHIKSLVIGDFGGTFYFGSDPMIHQHIARCNKLVAELTSTFQEGMTFDEVYRESQKMFLRHQVMNQASESKTDPTGQNLGHTVPFTFPGDSQPTTSLGEVSKTISNSRQFLSKGSSVKIPKYGCFIFEAQLRDQNDINLPMVLIHHIVIMNDGIACMLR